MPQRFTESNELEHTQCDKRLACGLEMSAMRDMQRTDTTAAFDAGGEGEEALIRRAVWRNMDGAKQYGICGVTAGKGICGNPGTAQAAGRIRGTARTASDGSKSCLRLSQIRFWGSGGRERNHVREEKKASDHLRLVACSKPRPGVGGRVEAARIRKERHSVEKSFAKYYAVAMLPRTGFDAVALGRLDSGDTGRGFEIYEQMEMIFVVVLLGGVELGTLLAASFLCSSRVTVPAGARHRSTATTEQPKPTYRTKMMQARERRPTDALQIKSQLVALLACLVALRGVWSVLAALEMGCPAHVVVWPPASLGSPLHPCHVDQGRGTRWKRSFVKLEATKVTKELESPRSLLVSQSDCRAAGAARQQASSAYGSSQGTYRGTCTPYLDSVDQQASGSASLSLRRCARPPPPLTSPPSNHLPTCYLTRRDYFVHLSSQGCVALHPPSTITPNNVYNFPARRPYPRPGSFFRSSLVAVHIQKPLPPAPIFCFCPPSTPPSLVRERPRPEANDDQQPRLWLCSNDNLTLLLLFLALRPPERKKGKKEQSRLCHLGLLLFPATYFSLNSTATANTTAVLLRIQPPSPSTGSQFPLAELVHALVLLCISPEATRKPLERKSFAKFALSFIVPGPTYLALCLNSPAMEASSPLAALHRPMPAPSWGGRDIFRSHSFVGPVASAALSLREQLQRGTSDYFACNEPRGSSPAASLAADLSQNFRLDSEASPHFPTPRRALFTANVMGGFHNRDYVTTPPLPSSSPAQLTEYMELSPLPHKTPFSLQSEFASPTPNTSSSDEDMILDSPAPILRPSLDFPKLPSFADRRIAAPRRPSLSRMKGHSLAGSSFKSEADGQLPRSALAAIPCPARAPISLLESASSLSHPLRIRDLPPHSRRSSNPFLRARKQVRRSLSMFEHPNEVMNAKSQAHELISTPLKSVMDIEEAYEAVIPHFLSEDPTDTIPRITNETMLDIIDGKFNDQFDHKMVIDCRFEYEYDGGHIEGAVNHNDKELLTSQLFTTPIGGRSLLIFHCEYSAHRAPLMARHVRAEDRTVNAEFYPRLTYPEVYILDGGYSGFFSTFRGRCFPPEYVEMSDEKHQRTCEREMGRLKARKGGLNRAQTFAFGQKDHCINDSPTAPGRPTSRQFPIMGSFSPIPERSHTRRMASY
ncbi:cell cycle control protein tyrosine phosphatase Mih1 [Cordyceps militaris CM01]|uniref:M-phase inducer phosphatase n=1 Tax=Cordyceps militaris (strain CM01) TaxID=983644 RepID=G3JLT5_CORMM|nr:cell cycle control protein tyrosine phosphatase Mih1 [Cordyceps militaris CM01]EGX90659.1 cell cycle control protein tyrosine phosphatase Mih1 [Cordyceps militaris CM01]